VTCPARQRRPPPRQRRATGSKQQQRGDTTTTTTTTTIWINDDYHQHTDDSEVERRVARLLYEIDHSVTDSVDESKIHSQEFEVMSD